MASVGREVQVGGRVSEVALPDHSVRLEAEQNPVVAFSDPEPRCVVDTRECYGAAAVGPGSDIADGLLEMDRTTVDVQVPVEQRERPDSSPTTSARPSAL